MNKPVSTCIIPASKCMIQIYRSTCISNGSVHSTFETRGWKVPQSESIDVCSTVLVCNRWWNRDSQCAKCATRHVKEVTRRLCNHAYLSTSARQRAGSCTFAASLKASAAVSFVG